MDERMNHFTMYQSAGFMQETELLKNFISAIQSENTTTNIDPIEKFCLNYECNHFTDSCNELQLPHISYGHNGAGIGDYDALDPNLGMIWNQEEEVVNGSRVLGDNDSSEADIPDTPKRRKGGDAKGDRTRSLVSERKRRSGMKENLYALRALVPNITKMDKASIVGDAARYIQDLQRQARTLKAEIATIEAAQNPYFLSPTPPVHVLKKISKMDVFQVEEKEYYVRLICNKGRGVAASLHRALEESSITSFQVLSSNLATVGDNFVLTFTLLNVAVSGFEINLLNLKLWLSGAFLNQGFEFETIPDGLD
uniref:transcription factor FER-LIKE IRON DEFICIENCY-INDUCED TRANSCRIPTION FACTOR-like n=1 Tax=Erigeron canadensis TaxID=72917 RepID=UPI001CB88F97|nr:transcription factor FER-LIKE IRON DEFICIENCY-INDUCED TRANSCRIPTION FACTOR-like [Erigeron canadensis]